MRVTNIRFRDLVTFVAISGILLLTAARYVETQTCHCVVNMRSHFPTEADRRAIEQLLREILGRSSYSPASAEVPPKKETIDGSR
jgi:hypothetical protein